LIAREDCFRCHDSGDQGGTLGHRSWMDLGNMAATDPERFRKIIHDPSSVKPGARMPGEPGYDAATLDALVAYFRTFASSHPVPSSAGMRKSRP
jgi:cytochrome c1